MAWSLVWSSTQVAWLAIRPGPPPLTAVLRAHLDIKSDLVLALAVNILNLIPGSIVLEIDQVRRIVYVHVIDVSTDRAVEQFHRQVRPGGTTVGGRVRARQRMASRRGRRGRTSAREHRLGRSPPSCSALAAAITMFRLLAGPGTLDRLVALDTLIAVTMCGVGTWAAYSLDTTVTYSLAALALISFVGSVSIARFRVRDIDRTPDAP